MDPLIYALQRGQGARSRRDVDFLFWLSPLVSLLIAKGWGHPVTHLSWTAPDLALRCPEDGLSRRSPDRTAWYLSWANLYQTNPELALIHLYGVLLVRIHARTFDIACQLALMMGRHPRLGRESPLKDLEDLILRSLAMEVLVCDGSAEPSPRGKSMQRNRASCNIASSR